MMRPRQAQSKAQTDSSVPNLGGLSGVASSQERPMAEKTMQAQQEVFDARNAEACTTATEELQQARDAHQAEASTTMQSQLEAFDMHNAEARTTAAAHQETEAAKSMEALQQALEARDHVLGLPMIRNAKTVDPKDDSTAKVFL